MTTRDDLQDFCQRNGYLGACDHPEGVAFVRTTVVGEGHICVAQGTHPEDGITSVYSYTSPHIALNALRNWAAQGFRDEPNGWHRHQPSNRRRENGDPTREEVRP